MTDSPLGEDYAMLGCICREEGETFKYSVFLVLNNRMISMIVAVVILGYQRAR